MTTVLNSIYLKQPHYLLFSCFWLILAVDNSEIIQTKPEILCPSHHSKAESNALATETIEVAALGRPLYPGMLYDSRKDTFIPGVTLWDKKSLSEDLDSRSQLQTDLKFSSSDTVSSKTKLLDISASLKGSFMSGLVEVGGSAKYLSDSKSSNQQARVTMFYSETSRFEQLTMTQLGKITYPQVFDQKTATHVVTAVLYGAQAFMVFDQNFSDSDDGQDIEGELHVMVKKIPSFAIEGQGAVKLTDKEIKLAEQISCTFHGDFRLEENPTTYLEALEIYKKLPHMLKDNPQNMVPLKVWLYPLSLLDSKAARLERELSSSHVSIIAAIIEHFEEVERICNDLLRHKLVRVFKDVRDRLNSFQSSFQIFKITFQKQIGRVLSAIRAGEQDDQALEKILSDYNSSPFNVQSLGQWLEDAKSELLLLNSNTLDGIKVEDRDGLNHKLLDLDVDAVVSLTFTSLQYEDQYLSRLKEYLQIKYISEKKEFPVESDKKWFKDHDVIAKMRESLSHFRSISENNKYVKKLCFIISAISDLSRTGSSIYLYEKGKLTSNEFQPVTKPHPPIVNEVKDQTISLKLQKSPSGETLQYRVEYKPVTADSGSVENNQWFVIDTYNEDVTLTGLESGCPYSIRYRTMGKIGVSEASDSVSVMPIEGQTVTVGEGDGWDISLMTPSLTSIKKIQIVYLKVFLRGDVELICALQGIHVTFKNGHTINVGSHTGKPTEMIFDDDDQLTSATLWPTADKKGVGGLEFVAAKSDGSKKTFSIKCSSVGDPVHYDVKSGKCYGLKVKVGEPAITSLGFYFI